ncbi:single-stranded DNA-binding protein 2-like isoform X2 [Hydractinia symbiolongicarpus]|uniref:single-stranded DNA-binding protein 2-like isoform X2 n=1 Tax=Hydractinia symbiolongicarpus TaxID=13093 RepID=UPI00254BB778|nr:single-stranded DNA-binding protein 2-like isoform X2 [Hydractinia symbiolongicarpus]
MIREAEVPEIVTQADLPNSMFPNKQTERTNKGSTSSNGSTSSVSNSTSAETQATEKLAMYVYEYLLHRGANRAAQTFLSEIQWEKNITLSDSPGFLHNWWSVFWDLYSAAPERQDPHNHSQEAKAFHDLSAGKSPSYVPQPTGDMSSMGNMPPGGYYQFMNNRYNMGRPSIRMPNQSMGPGGQSPFSTMDPSRQQQAGSYQTSPMMSPGGMRNFSNGIPPGVPPSYNRIPSMSNGGMMGGGPMGPTNMQMGPRAPWSNPPTPSPLTPGPPRTPILSSPQDPTTPFGMDASEPQLPLTEPPDNLEELPAESTESAAIQRIKESMKEEVKKFESDNPHDYYNMH